MDEILRIQNENLKKDYSRNTKKLIIFTVPGWNGVNGGVMSICSIARVTKDIFAQDNDCEVIIATIPKAKTFAGYDQFEAGFDVFRFEQLSDYFTELKEVIIHLPENFVVDFEKNINNDSLNWLNGIEKKQINILNQNIWYMPSAEKVNALREITPNITMTISHKKFCTKRLRDKYKMPVHFFSTSNLVKYEYKNFEDKEDIILYSPDEHPLKKKIISDLKKQFEDFKFIEIKNLSYEQYRKLLSKSKFMITFGEGIDGYFCESARCGAIPFAAYNNEFFDERYEGLENIFEDYKDLSVNIGDKIKYLNKNKNEFKNFSDKLIALDKVVYNDEEYKKNIEEYYKGNYTYDYNKLLKERKKRVASKPLVSIVMATYNGEKYLEEQLESIKNLTYPNLELIISDDNSTDGTMRILNDFKKDYQCTIVTNNGKNGVNYNFENGLKLAKGEFIALCDQDDIWYSNKIELLIEKIDDYDLIHSGVDLIDADSQPHTNKVLIYEYSKDYTDYVYFENFIIAGWVLGCTSLIRREIVEKSPDFTDEMFFHDWWLTLLAIKQGNGVKYIKDKTIKYRQHDSNTAQATYKTSKHYLKKIEFNKYIDEYFNTTLTLGERITLQNNTNYSLSKYFLLNDYYGNYKEVDKVLKETANLIDRKFLNKFTEIIISDVDASNSNSNSNKFNSKGVKRRIQQPDSRFDYFLRNLYLDVYVKYVKK